MTSQRQPFRDRALVRRASGHGPAAAQASGCRSLEARPQSGERDGFVAGYWSEATDHGHAYSFIVFNEFWAAEAFAESFVGIDTTGRAVASRATSSPSSS
jgi:hypothetical protein